MSLRAPLHRQYKTAQTETPRHLLLKRGQMTPQTSALRGYVLLDIKVAFMPPVVWVPIRDTHKSPTNCLPGCGHDPRSAPNLERHGSSRMQISDWLEMPRFLIRISRYIPSEIEGHDLFGILLLTPGRDCLLQAGSPFFFALFYDRRKKESYFFGQVIELDIAGKEA